VRRESRIEKLRREMYFTQRRKYSREGAEVCRVVSTPAGGGYTLHALIQP
jgi:hypothetical protein